MPNFDFFLTRNGLLYTIERETEPISETILGLPNTEKHSGRKYIGFKPDTNININDCLINHVGERFYIIDVQMHFVQKEPYQLKAYYQTSYDKKNSSQKASAIFNIQNATSSVIGTQSVVNYNYSTTISELREQLESSSSSDKEELKRITDLIEMITNGEVPVQKGILSKFSDVLERNGWFTPKIASIILNWLTTRLP